MRDLGPRPEVSFRQLVAIATACRHAESVEWKERIKDRVSSLGFQTPRSEQVYRAMDALEHVSRKARHGQPARSRTELPPAPDPTIQPRSSLEPSERLTPVAALLSTLSRSLTR